MTQNVWRKCGSCKKDILFGHTYQKCSVSSCHKLIFCSVDCWNEHVPVMNHKNAWAQEEIAPHYNNQINQETESKKRILVTSKKTESNFESDEDILIVASKLKNYIKTKHGLNTSADVMEKLSQIVRTLSNKACQNAISEGRKTVMDRDFFSF